MQKQLIVLSMVTKNQGNEEIKNIKKLLHNYLNSKKEVKRMNKESAFWSSCDFIHFNYDETNKFSLPETTKKFLLDIGLPKCHDTFDASNIKFYNPLNYRV
jgi:hypothetical protein